MLIDSLAEGKGSFDERLRAVLQKRTWSTFSATPPRCD